MWPLKSEKRPLFWGFQHTFMGVSKEIDGKTFIFQSKPRHVTPQIDQKTEPCSEGFNTHLWCFKEIDGKMFILRVNLGMWPLKSIVLEKQALFWGFQHIFMGFPRR